jgi:hypothetical protein
MKTSARRMLLVAVGLCFTTMSYSQEIERSCRALIESGLRNLSVSQESEASLQTIFRRHCEKSGTVKRSSLGIGIDTVVEAIPFGLKGDAESASQSMTNFCKSYSSHMEHEYARNTREEKIVERAYDSFDACIALARGGIVVRHDVRDLNTFDFFLAPGFNRVFLQGVQVPQHVTCKGIDPTKADRPVVTFGYETNMELSGEQTLNVSCVRDGAAGANGVVEFPEATVTLLTNVKPRGNYSAYLPPDSKLPRDMASEINQSLTALQDSNDKLENQLTRQRSLLLSGRAVVGALNGHRPPFWATRTVPFVDATGKAVEFSRVPRVVAVPVKHEAQSGVSWAATVENVTTKDFTVRLISVGRSAEPNHGWSYAAAVDWIADARD